MDALNGVVGPSEIFLSVYSQNQTKAVSDSEGTFLSGDTVEISKEAFEKSDELKRSEFLMKHRGLSEEEITQFRDVLQRYADSGQDPNDFLKSLERPERRLVQRANGFDGDFSTEAIESFSEEGAVNLLQEQGHAFDVDLDGDERIEHGAEKGWNLLPVEATDAVKDAWDIVSEDMSFLEKTIMSISLMPLKIPGYPDATTIHGYNINKQGYPETDEGWIDLLGKVYDTTESNLKYQDNDEARENSKQHMRNLKKFMAEIENLAAL